MFGLCARRDTDSPARHPDLGFLLSHGLPLSSTRRLTRWALFHQRKGQGRAGALRTEAVVYRAPELLGKGSDDPQAASRADVPGRAPVVLYTTLHRRIPAQQLDVDDSAVPGKSVTRGIRDEFRDD